MKKFRIRPFFFVVIILSLGCREKFEPDIKITDQNVLVIEGFINAGTGPTIFRITRAQKFGYPEKTELNARVEVESESNVIYPLNETSNGFYEASQLNLNSTEKYRLRVVTGGKEYLSEPELPKDAPGIDEITWKRSKDGIRIYANAHDPTNKTRYYRWDYEETWQDRSYTTSYYEWDEVQSKVIKRNKNGKDSNLVVCYCSSKSTAPVMASSAKYAEDTIMNQPILFIPNASVKLGARYSVLLKQSAISRGTYEFHQSLMNTSESKGSIFDSQPSQIRGNIRCVSNPDELVIGYVSVIGKRTEKRIFIDGFFDIYFWGYDQNCGAGIKPPNRVDIVVADDNVNALRWYFQKGPNPRVPFELTLDPFFFTKDTKRIIYIPIDTLPWVTTPPPIPPRAWIAKAEICVDCRVRSGGTNVRPSFWIDY